MRFSLLFLTLLAIALTSLPAVAQISYNQYDPAYNRQPIIIIAHYKGGFLLGGGIISAVDASGRSGAFLGDINDTHFSAQVTLADALNGGGVAGAGSDRGPAAIGDLNGGTVFSRNNIALTNAASAESGRIWGGGVVGSYSYSHDSSIGRVAASFYRNQVTAATYINGGGLVGAFVVTGADATIGSITGNYIDNRITVATNLSGGGIIGSWSGTGKAAIGDISGIFKNNTIDAQTSYLRGGGIIGVRTYLGLARVGTVSGSFLNNQILVGGQLGGGGILGLYTAATFTAASRNNDYTSSLGGLDGARFINNRIIVGNAQTHNAYALAGVAAVTGLNEELTIRNSVFQDNRLTINGWSVQKAGGAGGLYIGTDRISSNPKGHEVTLTATAGQSTEFKNNQVIITEKNHTTSFFNSLTFGREWDNNSGKVLNSKADAVLNITPQTDSRVILQDPIRVDMNNHKTFTMNILGPGRFSWSGENVIDAGGTPANGAQLNFAGGQTELSSDFTAKSLLNSTRMRVNFGAPHQLFLNVTNRSEALAFFQGPASFTVSQNSRLAGIYYGIDSTADRQWLITDARGRAANTSFDLTASDLFSTSLIAEGQNLYLKVNNNRAIEPFLNSSSPNLRRAYQSGALSEAWNEAFNQIPSSRMEETFMSARAYPASLTAEGAVTQGLSSLKTASHITRQALKAASTAPALPVKQDDQGHFSDYRVWADYIGADGKQDGGSGYKGYDSRYNGVTFGGLISWNQRISTGLYGAYARAHASYDDLFASFDADITQLGFLAKAALPNNFHILLDVSYTLLQNDSARVSALDAREADFDQDIYGLGFSLGYDLHPLDETAVRPFFSLRYQHLQQDGFAETSLSPALNQYISSFSANSLASSFGVRLSHDFRLSEGVFINPTLSLAWRHEFADRQLDSAGGYSGSAVSFNLSSIKQKRDTADVGLDLKICLANAKVMDLNLQGGYHLEFNDEYWNQQFYFGLGVNF